MKILSLFDGMACGMLAMQAAGIPVSRYVAFEIDKYAVQTSTHNFPMIEQRGDVFTADFTEFLGFDFLVGGSPCTYWSIARTNNRETEASGLGWELFCQYVRALHEAKPKFFVYENNKSMSKAIRESIDKAFGFEAICINSALVSAQNRQRLYWVGKRMPDGTYAPLDIQQPEDLGILLRDILETTITEKGYALKPAVAEVLNVNPSGHGMNGAVIHTDGKSRTLTTNKGEGPKIIVPVQGEGCRTADCINPTKDGKSRTVDAHMGKLEHNLIPRMNNPNHAKQQYDCIAEPLRIGTIENQAKNPEHDSQQYRVYSPDAKSVTLCGAGGGIGAKTGLYAVPVGPGYAGAGGDQTGNVDIQPGECVDLSMPNSKTRRGRAMKNKSNCLTTSCEFYEYCGTLDAPVYQVKDGKITVKGKEYPIKLRDGCYIIRKLTVTECKRLQTVPDEYIFPVSDSQAYKMLGNGWTVEVIAHLLKRCVADG